jgi:hypothetical protein
LLANDPNGYVVQAWKTDRADTVELPHLLLVFLEPDTFIGATLAYTGRGTFRLTGRPITAPDLLAQLDLADGETAIEVPKLERTSYGAAGTR